MAGTLTFGRSSYGSLSFGKGIGHDGHAAVVKHRPFRIGDRVDCTGAFRPPGGAGSGSAVRSPDRLVQQRPHRFLPRRIDITLLSETALKADLRGDTVDPARHVVRRMIKAATYHGLSLIHTNWVWEARVILDL